MSKRAEEAIKSQKVKDAANDYCSAYYDWHNKAERIAVTSTFKQGYFEGYEQAEKDTIERAIAWLKENADKYIVDLTPTYPDAPVNIIVGGMCWEDLKKAMEEEK